MDVSKQEDRCLRLWQVLVVRVGDELLLWTTKQYGISIIKTRWDQSRSNRNGHSMIHRWKDMPKGAYEYVKETRLGCCLNVRSHSKTRVKCNLPLCLRHLLIKSQYSRCLAAVAGYRSRCRIASKAVPNNLCQDFSQICFEINFSGKQKSSPM